MVVVETENRPPGFSTRKISRKAFSLLGARQKAPFEMTQSTVLSSSGIFSISALVKETRSDRSRASARLVAWSTSFRDISSPNTFPVGPVLSAAINESIPRPDPKSSMVSPAYILARMCGQLTPWKL